MRIPTKVIIILSSLIAILLSSCQEIGLTRTEQNEMVGYWIIDQPMHALYEASLYEFRSSGELRLVENYAYGESSTYAVGSVWKSNNPECPPLINCTPLLTCEFADEWKIGVDRVLTVSGVCSDGIRRDIKISLRAYYSGSDAISYDIVILSVDGERGWYHGPNAWLWRKCIDLEACAPWRK